MEMHSVCTSCDAQVPELKKFFNAQYSICESYHRPLFLQSDCDKGIPAAFLEALAFENAGVVTRIQYHNLTLAFLAQYEVDNWDRSITQSHFTTMRSLLPCFFGNCRPHVQRAVSRWIKADKRPACIKNQLHTFK